MNHADKYKIEDSNCVSFDWISRSFVPAPPVWCSIDLAEGNRAFAEAMTQYEKEEYFKLLLDIGFKEINIGNPLKKSGGDFLSAIINKGLTEEDVSITVAAEADSNIIDSILNAVSDIENVILNIKSNLFLHKDFDASKRALLEAVKYAKEKAVEFEGKITLEVTLEFFRNTNVNKTVDVFNDISALFASDEKVILNLAPANEFMMPHMFASTMEYISKNLYKRSNVILSLRPCNDCGTGISTAEMSLLAGVDRIEGTLFGVGEKTGNVDIVNLAINICSKGARSNLNLFDLPDICENFERFTGTRIYEKLPYSGDSAFSVFSKEHQKAISAALSAREGNEDSPWDIPYLAIDPRDVGRDYISDVIRSDGLSGRNGIIYILNKKYGLQIPVKLKSELARKIEKRCEDSKELLPETVYRNFVKYYVEYTPVFTCPESHYSRDKSIKSETVIQLSSGNSFTVKSDGNGRLDAVSNAFKKYFDIDFDIDIYEEHAMTTGSKSKAVSYVCIKCPEGTRWGVGIHEDIFRSSVNALTVAVNQMKKVRNFSVDTDPRLIEMLDYIKDNYNTVTLDSLARNFYLSKQYVSKYIRDKSGQTFCENVQNFRMKKAEELLLTTGMTVESVAEKSGYPSVEHFNRTFKKIHGVSPLKFRKNK